ncbi:hypothetical protein [Chrysiogenes arsenatis]|uniref:hypothetical protein n=1 Tax=Chrysiogenes arsenatis TaxID=309797 RepID=UPI0003FE79C6|nr:hypothetical protein [Chrysiogenes arsenatis]
MIEAIPLLQRSMRGHSLFYLLFTPQGISEGILHSVRTRGALNRGEIAQVELDGKIIRSFTAEPNPHLLHPASLAATHFWCEVIAMLGRNSDPTELYPSIRHTLRTGCPPHAMITTYLHFVAMLGTGLFAEHCPQCHSAMHQAVVTAHGIGCQECCQRGATLPHHRIAYTPAQTALLRIAQHLSAEEFVQHCTLDTDMYRQLLPSIVAHIHWHTGRTASGRHL